MRTSYLPFSAPDLDGEELNEIREVLESGWITTGPKVKQFESEFAATVGARHAIAVNSCTAAMHLALEAVGVGPGDEVIVPSYTFAATAEVVRYFQARPVLVDSDPKYLNMNPDAVRTALTPRTKAIIPVHIAGLPADMDELLEIGQDAGIPLLEDSAHAFPAEYKGRRIGSISKATCFSFYATKTITTGEGGMITTDDDSLAERCRIMSLHGISRDAWKRYTAEGTWYYEIIAPGYKYNMTDVAAAMGVVQLRKAERMRSRRVEIADMFNSAFSAFQELEVPGDRPECLHSWHLYMLRLHLDLLTIDRGRFIEELTKRKIGVSVNFIPLHIHPYYRDIYGFKPEDFPVAYGEYQREISLPIYSRMSDADVHDVIEAVSDIVATYRA